MKIHAWVRNNVQWIPTWGAMQDATHTLPSRRGNAFDMASLESALLRASDIPAREWVIPPFLSDASSGTQAAMAVFIFGVIPPRALARGNDDVR